MKAWQVWARDPDCEKTLSLRAAGELPQMESTKQLVSIVRQYYTNGMKILDVGCNCGHYLRGLLEIDPDVHYTGYDAYDHYISQAKKIYKDFPNVTFEVKDIMETLSETSAFDIVFSCNLLKHLPEFQTPLKNLLNSSKSHCVVRTLLGEYTYIVKKATSDEFDDNMEPSEYIHQNTYSRTAVRDYAQGLGWNTEIIEDVFDPSVISNEFSSLKSHPGATNIIGGKQVSGLVLLNWEFAHFTPNINKSNIQ